MPVLALLRDGFLNRREFLLVIGQILCGRIVPGGDIVQDRFQIGAVRFLRLLELGEPFHIVAHLIHVFLQFVQVLRESPPPTAML